MPTTYAIPNGRTAMDATLYTGTGANLTVVNSDIATVGFKPDLVWAKSRGNAFSHRLVDSVRGPSISMFSNSTSNDVSESSVIAFNANGCTIGTNASVNTNGDTYVAWQWQAGQGSNTTNTTGTITSTVSANATAGFSIVTYTGAGSAATVGHGLGVAPQFVIVKNRTLTDDWCVYTSSTGATQYSQLNLTSAFGVNGTIWNNTSPTTSVFSVGTYLAKSASNYVAYCWAPVAGFSQFGSYTGNGSADGPFVYLGFRPKYILIKCTSSGYDWVVYDSSTGAYNVVSNNLWPNLSNAEYSNTASTGLLIDFLSNGFKIRGTNTEVNNSGLTYIYAAFAENPFKYANAK